MTLLNQRKLWYRLYQRGPQLMAQVRGRITNLPQIEGRWLRNTKKGDAMIAHTKTCTARLEARFREIGIDIPDDLSVPKRID